MMLVLCQQVLGDAPAAKYRLQRMISAREADFLREVPPNSLAALEQYADDTASQLQALQVRMQGFRRKIGSICLISADLCCF